MIGTDSSKRGEHDAKAAHLSCKEGANAKASPQRTLITKPDLSGDYGATAQTARGRGSKDGPTSPPVLGTKLGDKA